MLQLGPVAVREVIQALCRQVYLCCSLDLLLLREVVQKMAGIEVSEEITDDQLNSLSGGELLRQEVGLSEIQT